MTQPETQPGKKRTGLIGLAVSAGLLAFLYTRVNARVVVETLLAADPLWMLISVLGILPITAVRACRFLWVAPPGALPGVVEALRLTLVASALNILAPAKSGDLVKGYVVATRSETSTGVSLAIVVYERLCDLFGLIFWCVLGWLVARPQVEGLGAAFWITLGVGGSVCAALVLSTRLAETVRLVLDRLPAPKPLRKLLNLAAGWPDLLRTLGPRRWGIAALSLLLWLGHLVQIWTFTFALATPVPFLASASLSAIALMAGQLPFTVAGLGARDVALVLLMANYMPEETAAAMGLLIATRTLIPALLGVPFAWPYLSSMLTHLRRRRTRR